MYTVHTARGILSLLRLIKIYYVDQFNRMKETMKIYKQESYTECIEFPSKCVSRYQN